MEVSLSQRRRFLSRARPQRKARPCRLTLERLEDRLAPASDFARLTGGISVAKERDAVPVELRAADFTLPPGPKANRALLGFVLQETDPGSPLDPGALSITAQPKTTARAANTLKKIDLTTTDNASLLLARLTPGNFTLKIQAEGKTTGAYRLTVYLAADLNSDFQVTQGDLDQIAALNNVKRGTAGYLAEADVNQNGTINKSDLNLAKQNLGVSTSLRLTTLLTAALSTASDPDGDGVVTQDDIVIQGQAPAGKIVQLDQGADGSFEQQIAADASGNYAFNATVPVGATTFRVQTTAPFFNQPTTTDFVVTRTPAAIMLAEEANFQTQTTVTIPLGQTQGTRSLRFTIDPTFDGTDTAPALEDVFAVYLVDPANPNQTILHRDEPGTALFTLAGDQAEYTPGQVRFDGHTVEIDGTSLGNRTSGLLVFQLLNSDNDTGTTMEITNVQSIADPQGVVPPQFPVTEDEVARGPAVDLGSLTLSTQVELLVGNVRFDVAAGQYKADLRLRNNGPAIGGTVAVVFPGLPVGVQLMDPSGTGPGGAPYLNFRNAIAPGGLVAGAVSDPLEATFTNPGAVRFRLLPDVFVGGPNQAPTTNTLGPLTVLPGDRLAIGLSAMDADGDAVTVAVRSDGPLPTGFLQGDTFVFAPTPAEVGTYNLTFVASDGAAETTQAATLTVNADPITTTRISGVVRDTNDQLLAGVPVEIGGTMTTTASDGSFTLTFAGALPAEVLEVHGEQEPGATTFPLFAGRLPDLLEHPVYASVNNVLAAPIRLQPIDTANAVTINPAADTTVTTPLLSLLTLLAGAGTLRDEDNNLFNGALSLTVVSPDHLPFNLPPNLRPDMAVLVDPGTLHFTTPAPLTAPNTAGWAPDVMMDLWALNSMTGVVEDVGDGRVNTAGSLIQTITGGLLRTGLTFFTPQPVTPQNIHTSVFNLAPGASEQVQTTPFTSDVELHSGAVLETHDLVTYQSIGETRGVSLRYDALRADPRPIIHFGYPNVDPTALAGANAADLRMVARLNVSCGPFDLFGDDNYWAIPSQGGRIDAALQVDLSNTPSGICDYTVSRALLLANGQGFTGTESADSDRILHVNEVNSPFGAGWSIAGLQRIIENPDGSALLIDGDGSELLFGAPTTMGGLHQSPSGDFSMLQKFDFDGTYSRRLPDGTTYQFDASLRLVTVFERTGNQTRYEYDGNGNLTKIIDPVGLETVFTSTNGRVSSITDPANRMTQLQYDANGNLMRVIDPDTSQRTWEYDFRHHITKETNKRGFMETTQYGFHGRATEGTRTDGTTVQVMPVQVQGLYEPEATLDPVNAPFAQALQDGMAFDAGSNGNVTETELDQMGQTVSQRDAVGCIVAAIQRGDRNLPTLIQSCLGNSIQPQFDNRGNVLSYRDSLSGFTSQPNRQRIHFTSDEVFGAEIVGLGDFNGDGRKDVLTYFLDAGNNKVSTLFGNAGGGLSLKAETILPDALATDLYVSDVIADVNGDHGDDFVIFTDYYDVDLDAVVLEPRAYLANLDGTFTEQTGSASLPIGPFPRFALGDVTGDGNVDLVAMSRATTAEPFQLTVMAGDGSGRFLPPRFTPGPSSPEFATGYPAIGDVDGDGDRDVVVGTGAGEGLVYRNNGTGTFTRTLDPDADNASAVNELIDLDGDNLPELVGHFLASIGRNLGNGDFGATQPLSGPPRREVEIGRFNNDDLPDGIMQILTGVGQQTALRPYINNGNLVFQPGNDFATAPNPFPYAVGDIDGDGDDDVVVIEDSFNQIGAVVAKVFTNDGTGGVTSQAAAKREYTYDNMFNQLTSETDELGRRADYEIDPTNGNRLRETRSVTTMPGMVENVIRQFTYTTGTEQPFQPPGLLDTETDPLGRVTDYDYDPLGRLVKITYAVGTPDEAMRQFGYDAAGNQTFVIDENGNQTDSVYDVMNMLMTRTDPDPDGPGGQGRPVTANTYDPHGNLLTETDARGNVTTRRYDALDRLDRLTQQDPDAGGPLPAPVTQLIYNPMTGNLDMVIDPVGRVTENTYDDRNRLKTVTDAEGGVTTYEYDEADNRTAIIDPVGNRTMFGYDGRNRQTSETDPRGKIISYEFDAVNNRTAIVDRLGRRTVFAYDELDRLVTETWINVGGGNANVITSKYRLNGTLSQIDDTFSKLVYTYDNRDRVLTVDNAGTPGAPQVALTYTYDDVGNVLTLVDSRGGTNAYQPDPLNRVKQITQTGTGVSDKRVNFFYNEVGQFAAIERYRDTAGTQMVVRSTYAYDGLNRIVSLTHDLPAGTDPSYALTYNAAGNISQIIDIDGTHTYTYDDTNQLTGVTHSNPAIPNQSFTFDLNGNRTGGGRVTQAGNRLQTDGTFTYEYDDEGNLVRRTTIAGGAVREFAYDHRNRLTTVTDKPSLAGTATRVIRYVYDALDRRIAKNVDTTPQDAADGVVTHFVYDREDVLLDFTDPDGSGPQPAVVAMRYLHGPGIDHVLAQDAGGSNVLWLLPDHLGSTRDLVDNTGAVVNHIIYDAFGNIVLQSNQSFSTRYLFTGREFDIETGLYYYRARYYDPMTGRFLSEDRLRFDAGDANLYRYVGNNALGFADPTGAILKAIGVVDNIGISNFFNHLFDGAKPGSNTLRIQTRQFFDPIKAFGGGSAEWQAALKKLTNPTRCDFYLDLDSQGGRDRNAFALSFKTGDVYSPDDIDKCDYFSSFGDPKPEPTNKPENEGFQSPHLAAVEWLFLAGLGVLAGGRLYEARRKRRRAGQSPLPKTKHAERDQVFAELADGEWA